MITKAISPKCQNNFAVELIIVRIKITIDPTTYFNISSHNMFSLKVVFFYRVEPVLIYNFL